VRECTAAAARSGVWIEDVEEVWRLTRHDWLLLVFCVWEGMGQRCTDATQLRNCAQKQNFVHWTGAHRRCRSACHPLPNASHCCLTA
jgi:hypothetical protein